MSLLQFKLSWKNIERYYRKIYVLQLLSRGEPWQGKRQSNPFGHLRDQVDPESMSDLDWGSEDGTEETIECHDELKKEKIRNQFTCILLNARLLLPKMKSFLTLLDEMEVDVSIITETWMREIESDLNAVTDIEERTGYKFIMRSRKKKRGGGWR